jgi:methyl-accepting chemotaxis protein
MKDAMNAPKPPLLRPSPATVRGPSLDTRALRLRTFSLVAVPLAPAILFMLFFVPARQRSALMQRAENSAQVLTAIFAENSTAPVLFDDQKGLLALLQSAAKDPDFSYIEVIAPDGRVLATHGKTPSTRKTQLENLESWQTDGLLHVAAPIRKDAQVVAVLQAGFSTDRIEAEARSFRLLAMALTIAVLAIGAVMAVLLGRSFFSLFEQLRQSILRTARSVDEVVNQLAAVTAEQTSAASEESTALHETNATAAEVNQTALQAAQRAAGLIEGGGRAESAAQEGLQSVALASDGLKGVREQMNTLASTISSLSDRAKAIGEIASTVAVLAERSNLLALNAAIEAARAGAQGRGFSVVAQEMRNLADGSNRSASQVKAIIAEIEGPIARAVADTREGERRLQNAEELARGAGESIRKFANVTREFAAAGKEIAEMARTQSGAIEQMVDSISHATEAGGTQLETTKQVEETTGQLRQLSSELLAVVSGAGAVDAPPTEPPVAGAALAG